MSSRYYQLQNEATNSRTSSPHRPQNRTSTSSDSSSSSSSSSSYNSSYADSSSTRYSMDASQPRVEVMRCSRCAKCVETVISAKNGGELRRVSTDDAQANGMVRFGTNLYYCDRCARMVGYK